MFTDNVLFCKISVRVLVYKNGYKHNERNEKYYILELWNFRIVLCDIYY
jgi:hypothetical protein